MIHRINQLPPLVANQIAAGEVIERPASVVKELLENAFDAQATEINIEVGYGGLNLIKISDNGTGIVAEDLPLAIAAHATSKIHQLDDLMAIASMGFRGEALASIAAVSRIIIRSKPEFQDQAMMLSVENDNMQIASCARSRGTTIEVHDIFFNAPVRKRFLKTAQQEFQAIEGVVKRFALSAPAIKIALSHNDKPSLQLPAAHDDETFLWRVRKLFGKAFIEHAIDLTAEHAGISLKGWVANTAYQRSQNDQIWTYLNARMIKDKLITHAIKKAYADWLHPGRYPACLVYLTVPPTEVDVNVHPTKHEVRFQRPRLIHDFIVSRIQHTLNQITQPTREENHSLLRELPETTMRSSMLREPPQSIYGAGFQQATEIPWFNLHGPFAVLLLKNAPFLVDVIALQREFLLFQLLSAEFPLKSRRMLVQVNYSLPELTLIKFRQYIPLLNEIGIGLKERENNRMQVEVIPSLVPHLNIKRFLDALSQLNGSVCRNTLLKIMAESQQIALDTLQGEEKEHLAHFLQDHLDQSDTLTRLCRPLTSTLCREILHG